METKITPFTPKNAEIFSCEKCNFTCFKISDWERHLSTLKHERKRLETFGNKKNADKNSIQYQCENKYKFRCTGLFDLIIPHDIFLHVL